MILAADEVTKWRKDKTPSFGGMSLFFFLSGISVRNTLY